MKVGIIGAGAAGLATAWLLDQECKVIIFEQSNRLGGHAHTVLVEQNGYRVPVEIGFEFFNAWLFPTFLSLLKALDVPVVPFPLTYCFYTTQNVLTLSSNHPSKVLKQLSNPSVLATLFQFLYALHQGRNVVKKADKTLTIKQFADNLFLSDVFKNNFFYPFLTAGWGCRIDEFKNFCAYDVLSWITQKALTLKPQQWYEIDGGISRYINKLVEQLYATMIYKESSIEKVLYEYGNYIIIENGRRTSVDHLIIATNPQQAAVLLKDLEPAQKHYRQLRTFQGFPAQVAVHGDSRFMPKKKSDWSVANVRYNGNQSALTVFKPWHLENLQTPIFRSWILDDDIQPEPLYAVEHFHHQKVMPNYFEAQKNLKLLQGENNIWLAGCYMDNLDSHESAIASALSIAQRLAPNSGRLGKLI